MPFINRDHVEMYGSHPLINESMELDLPMLDAIALQYQRIDNFIRGEIVPSHLSERKDIKAFLYEHGFYLGYLRQGDIKLYKQIDAIMDLDKDSLIATFNLSPQITESALQFPAR